jgi:hypothetical protein
MWLLSENIASGPVRATGNFWMLVLSAMLANSAMPGRFVPPVVALLYFVIVAFLVIVAVLNPDGGLSGVPAMMLTLPWSIPLSVASFTVVISALIVAFGGAMNAAVLYVLVKGMAKRFDLRATIVVLVLFASFATVAVWFINSQEVNNLVRIVHGSEEAGVWVATNEDGLRAMSETNGTASDVPKSEARNRLVFIPNETRGRYKGRKFLLKGGRLVDPYPANTHDMERAEAVEVEKIKITEGPSEGLEGWVQTNHLKRLLTLYSM